MGFDTVNPATGEKISTYQGMSAREVQEVLEKCAQAQKKWARIPVKERAKRMIAAHGILLKNKEKYARIISMEMGKPLPQAISEVEKCAWACEYYAENGPKFLDQEIVPTEAKKSLVAFRPLGVVLAVMPWNYPLWQVFRFAAPTLTAGNGAVLKHAPNVFGSSLTLEEIFREADFPENLFRSLIIDIPQTTEVIRNPLIAAVTITASVGAGRAVATEAGKVLKKCVLELGGSDPFIVLEDADIDKAVEVGIVARYLNTGQSCIAGKRFILVEKIREEFEKKFVEQARQLKMGDPFAKDVYLGPMARRDLRDGLHDQVRRSVDKGARLLLGGEVPSGPGAYYPPTVLTDVKEGMAAWSEEFFGPVAIMIPVKDEAEAIRVANITEFGLGGSVWTRDLARGERIAVEEIQSGACMVNSMTKSDPRLPFGGIKSSGYGRELSLFGIREFVNIHTVWIN